MMPVLRRAKKAAARTVSMFIGRGLPATRRGGDWRLLRWLPPRPPSVDQLRAFQTAKKGDYEGWLRQQGVTDLAAWYLLRNESLRWHRPPRLSVVTPVYDTEPNQLEACVRSVSWQTYPFWQLCAVDDGSSRPDVWPMLNRWARMDPRIQVFRRASNGGICAASNEALAAANGDFVAFLDHDDCLAPDALHRVAEALRAEPASDVLYSDRDMLAASSGRRFMHLLKPAWSPETLLSGNYIFHLTVYRRKLLVELGGLRPAYEGSQDYDLILRASERTERIRHIPRVLYHWREHPSSIANSGSAKRYVYDAGKAALTDALRRRGFDVSVVDVQGFRGHYRPVLPVSDPARVEVLRPTAPAQPAGYARWLQSAMARIPGQRDLCLVLAPGLEPRTSDAVEELLKWLALPGVGIVTGRLSCNDGRLLHAGLVHRTSGVPLALYQGFPGDEPGYMAYTSVLRNVAAPHPWCFGFRRGLWDALGGLSSQYSGPHAVLDFALRALASGWRAVYVPYAELVAEETSTLAHPWLLGEGDRFAEQWRLWLRRGDPFYPVGMTLERSDMSLAAGHLPPALR